MARVPDIRAAVGNRVRACTMAMITTATRAKPKKHTTEERMADSKIGARLQKVLKAAEADAWKAYSLGRLYETGWSDEVGQDFGEAIQWYRKAADKDVSPAQHQLGLMYETGQGVHGDCHEAAKWYRKAADQDYSESQFALGMMYSEGRGVPQDYVESHKWLNLAASNPGIGSAKEKKYVDSRDSVAKLMTRDQIADAQRLAKEWMILHADERRTITELVGNYRPPEHPEAANQMQSVRNWLVRLPDKWWEWLPESLKRWAVR